MDLNIGDFVRFCNYDYITYNVGKVVNILDIENSLYPFKFAEVETADRPESHFYVKVNMLEKIKTGNIQPGNIVRVLGSARRGEHGWENDWVSGMDRCVGKIFVVYEVDEKRGVSCVVDSGHLLYFPKHVLEKVSDYKFENEELVYLAHYPTKYDYRNGLNYIPDLDKKIGTIMQVKKDMLDNVVLEDGFSYPHYVLERVEKDENVGYRKGDYVILRNKEMRKKHGVIHIVEKEEDGIITTSAGLRFYSRDMAIALFQPGDVVEWKINPDKTQISTIQSISGDYNITLKGENQDIKRKSYDFRHVKKFKAGDVVEIRDVFCRKSMGESPLTVLRCEDGIAYCSKSRAISVEVLVKVEKESDQNELAEKFKKGDVVRVLGSARRGEHGWENDWVSGMDRCVGKLLVVSGKGSVYGGIPCDTEYCEYYFPAHVLKLVSETSFNKGDLVRVTRKMTPEEMSLGVWHREDIMEESIGKVFSVVEVHKSSVLLSNYLHYPFSILEKAEVTYKEGDYIHVIGKEEESERTLHDTLFNWTLGKVFRVVSEEDGFVHLSCGLKLSRNVVALFPFHIGDEVCKFGESVYKVYHIEQDGKVVLSVDKD